MPAAASSAFWAPFTFAPTAPPHIALDAGMPLAELLPLLPERLSFFDD
jgi:hypothetical protein